MLLCFALLCVPGIVGLDFFLFFFLRDRLTPGIRAYQIKGPPSCLKLPLTGDLRAKAPLRAHDRPHNNGAGLAIPSEFGAFGMHDIDLAIGLSGAELISYRRAPDAASLSRMYIRTYKPPVVNVSCTQWLNTFRD